MESLSGILSSASPGTSPSGLPASFQSASNPISKKVFIVHGHDEQLKDATESLVRRLGLDPIILHQQPNQGRTLIEKFSDHAEEVGFAIVLLSCDDQGKSQEDPPTELKPRARQNVILELGLFFGSLGRGKVCAVYEKGLELPSDLQGLAYVEYDQVGKWKYDVAKELRAAGYKIKLDKV
jgi:predicted nucleotide-binding protein